MDDMARPAKAVNTLKYHATKEELDERKAVETALRGADDSIAPPDWLNDGQKKVFEFVIAELAASKILGNIDVYVLTVFAVATERICTLEQKINEHLENDGLDKDLIFARNSYFKDFWRGANELSLSPQARAKIGTLNLAQREEENDPLRKLLAGKG